MNTAQEWQKKLSPHYDDAVCSVGDIKAIQLDAFKAGMTEAANQAPIHLQSNDQYDEGYNDALNDFHNAITKARDAKTTV